MKQADFDSSGFQNIVLMLIGVLMMMLVSNVLTIISNPENIKIGALVTGTVYSEETDEDSFIPPKFQNLRQDPLYIDVEANKLIIYGGIVNPERKEIAAKDLMFEGNEFEKFLDEVEQAKATRYIVLLLRPGSAVFQRKLRKVIRERGIDVGFEPWEAGREIMVAGAGPASAEAEAGSGEAAAEPVPAEPTAPVEGETSAAEGI